jgi:hypothetical protein
VPNQSTEQCSWAHVGETSLAPSRAFRTRPRCEEKISGWKVLVSRGVSTNNVERPSPPVSDGAQRWVPTLSVGFRSGPFDAGSQCSGSWRSWHLGRFWVSIPAVAVRSNAPGLPRAEHDDMLATAHNAQTQSN